MIKELNDETRERVSKAIVNMRLIASRVKRASLEEAIYQANTVISALDGFRKFVNASIYDPQSAGFDTAFRLDTDTLNWMLKASQTADSVFQMLTKVKKASYKEEIRQVILLLTDITEFLLEHAEKAGVNAKS